MTAADAAPLTWTYIGEAIGFGAFLLLILLYALWATRDGRRGVVERWLDDRIARRRRRAAQAIANGDEHVLRAVVEMEHSR